MATETPAVFSPEDLRKNLDRLQSDLAVVQNELDQALNVWRAILASEKQEYKKQLDEHAAAWDKDEVQWQKDRLAYEEKIRELESFFQEKLSLTDKNAVHALNELDAAWQQERAKWQQTFSLQSKESRQRDELQTITQQQMEQRLALLDQENQQLKEQLANSQAFQVDPETIRRELEQPYQAQLTAWEQQAADWQAEKAAWQDAEQSWMIDRQDKESTIQSLQGQCAAKDSDIQSLQQQIEAMRWQQRQPPPVSRPPAQPPVETYMNALETQVASLQQFVQQMLPSSYPQRRRSDQPTPPSAGRQAPNYPPPRASY